MSEFNPDQSHGYRERAGKKGKTRRELLGIGARSTPAIFEKQKPIEKPQLPPNQLTRRDLIKVGAAVTATLGISKDLIDTVSDMYAEEEFSEPEKIKKPLELLDELNLELPQDNLYGFTFPSTREMAQKYQQALGRKLASEPTKNWFMVSIIRGRPTLTKTILGLSSILDSPTVYQSSGPDDPAKLNIPSWILLLRSPAELAATVYHEGIHLFYQQKKMMSDQTVFDRENMAYIGDIFLIRLLRSRGYDINNATRDLEIAYDKAVDSNGKEIWEQELKKLEGLPQNCCTYQPSLEQDGQK